MRAWSLCIGFLIFVIVHGNAQTVDFQVPATACQKEYVQFVNNSTQVSSVKWDFCAGGLESNYKTFSAGLATDLMTNLVVIQDNSLWYGFATSRNNVLVRIDFGTDPNNAPLAVTSIGNPGNLLNSPESIDMVHEGSSWIALIGNAGNEIIRLTWTGAVTGTPVAESLNLTAFGKLNLPTEIEIKMDGNNYIALIANASGSSITMINFGTSLSNQPLATDMQVSPAFPNATDLYSVSAVEQCGEWIIYAIGSNHIYRVVIGSALFSPITGEIQDFSADVPSIGSYNHIKAIASAENTYVYFTSYTLQNISAAIWRKGATHAQYLDLGISAFAYGTYGLDAVYFNGNYSLYVSGFLSGQLTHVVTTSPCSSNIRFSNALTPQNIFYSQSGTAIVSLSVTYTTGEVCSETKSLTINGLRSPQPTIQIDSVCLASPITFTSVSADSIPIVQWNWTYGDGASQSGQKTFHQYTAQGGYTAALNVIGNNGCQNNIFKDLTVYAPPVAGFTLPADSVCSNNVITLSNTTPDVFNGNLSFAWKVNNKIVSTQADFNTIIPTAGTNQITLVASIPGCSAQNQQTLSGVKSGPLPDFLFFNNCDGKATQFANESTGSIYARSWDFGDGHSSAATNPQNIFLGIGDYIVTLTDSSKNGCNNSVRKKVTVYSTPQSDFNLDLPPFSCSGSPAQFNDNTPKMPDSNAITWSWTFGDLANGTSNQQNPAYTYAAAGNFTAGLTVTTNFNCSATVQKLITIAQTPTADFSVGPACFDQNTQFTDLSGPTVKSRVWKISNSTTTLPLSTSANPVFVLSSVSSYTALLTITDNNACIGKISKTVIVPAPLAVDFSTQNNCSGKQAVFTDITPAGQEIPVSRSWNFNNIGTGMGSPARFTFPSTGSVSVTMTTTAQSGCVYPVTKTISIAAPPIAAFTTPTDDGPAPLKVMFANTSTNATTYVWHFDDVASSTSTATSPSFTFTTIGDYHVALVAYGAQNCQDTATKIIHVVGTGIDLALSNLQLVPDLVTGQIKIHFQITNNGSSLVTNPAVFLAVDGSGAIEEDLNLILASGQVSSQILNYVLSPSAGSVCVKVKEAGDSDLENDQVCASVGNQDVVFSPYPNPASGLFQIDWIAAGAETAQIVIVSNLGQVIRSNSQHADAAGLTKVAINVSDLLPGGYVILITYKGGQKAFRFIVN